MINWQDSKEIEPIDFHLKIAFAVLNFSNSMNNFIKMMSKEKFKTSEPFGSALWPNLLRYQPLAIVHYGCVSDALHIRLQDACNF
jgi:hypothetical protein